MRIRYSFSCRKTGRIEGGNQHYVPVPKLVREVIRISDIVLEVIDARFIEKSRNPEMEDEIRAAGKTLIYVLNKADLVDITELKKNIELNSMTPYVLFSCKSVIGRKRLRDMIKIYVKKMKLTEKRAQVGVIGYPNAGKSSLINLLVGRKAVGTAAEAGFTKGMHKIRFAKGILIIDTPGVIPEKESAVLSSKDLKKHAELGVQTYDKVKNPDFVVSNLMKAHPGLLERYYSIKADGDAEVLLESLGKQRKLLLKGGAVDTDRMARIVLKDWQEGKIKPC